MLLLVEFFDFLEGLRAALRTEKMTAMSSQMLICLVLLSLLRSHLRGVGAVRGCGGAIVRPTKQIRGRRHDAGGWWQGRTSLSVQARTRR